MPVDVVGLSSGVRMVAVGHYYTCAVLNDDTAKCWGYNGYGQLGDGTTATRNTPVDVVGFGGGVRSIDAGENHTCAVRDDGAVKCWGYNGYGQLGDGTTINSNVPVDVSGLNSGVRIVSAGHNHTCAVRDDGATKCWGYNGFGQLGDNTTTNSPSPVDVLGMTNSVGISAGKLHTCAVTTAGAVKCWGWNGYGQIGDGTSANRLAPVQVFGMEQGFAAVSAGSNHTCAITLGDVARCWGYNSTAGVLGSGSNVMSSYTPVRIDDGGVLSVHAGDAHACALTTSGGVVCWGDNSSGQLGNGSTSTNSALPVDVSGLGGDVIQVTSGYQHSCAVTAGGAVKCWGANSQGQLGDGTTANSSIPVAVSGLNSGVIAVSAGSGHTCAQMGDGAVKCWGNDGNGQLGNGGAAGSLTPVDVSGLGAAVKAISAGSYHTCALTVFDSVVCWGLNVHGQVGDGTTNDAPSPVGVVGLGAAAIGISAGYMHTCARITLYVVKCWGYNDRGQLGDGTAVGAPTAPVPANSAESFTMASSGLFHTCALAFDGDVLCWGENSDGQLGNDTLANAASPVYVNGLESSGVAVSAGGRHSCAVNIRGDVLCWGRNAQGQLGNGITVDSPKAVDVAAMWKTDAYIPAAVKP
jgi:alpha-tubulin suppressor-like RCC1 family protein